LYATQNSPTDLNNTYWDDAALTVATQSTTIQLAPQETAIHAPGALPVAQAPLADGSIIHTVQPGDTFDGIAMVYGLTRAQLLSLNPLVDPRVLRVGQSIVVRPTQ
jgi:LysM repeat protein